LLGSVLGEQLPFVTFFLAGFAVLEAANGREALALATTESRLDAVLTDLAMPEIGGQELARRLRETRPGASRHVHVRLHG
jgi:CheY-like chemotaxis protein